MCHEQTIVESKCEFFFCGRSFRNQAPLANWTGCTHRLRPVLADPGKSLDVNSSLRLWILEDGIPMARVVTQPDLLLQKAPKSGQFVRIPSGSSIFGYVETRAISKPNSSLNSVTRARFTTCPAPSSTVRVAPGISLESVSQGPSDPSSSLPTTIRVGT
jgi:hypothetical protein